MSTVRNRILLTSIAVTILSISVLPVFATEFTKASIVLEHNATDDDAEIVVTIKGGDEGLAKLTVYAPDGKVVLDLSTKDRIVGLRQFAIESAEPETAKVLGAFPEGVYHIKGMTINGASLDTSFSLSHRLPSPTEIKVNKTANIVTWSSVAGAVKYSIEIELEDDDVDLMKLNVELPATVTSFSIPKEFTGPGDYQVGVAVHGANGNIVVVEEEFSRIE